MCTNTAKHQFGSDITKISNHEIDELFSYHCFVKKLMYHKKLEIAIIV